MKNQFVTLDEKFENIKKIERCEEFAFPGFSPRTPSYCDLLLIEHIDGKKVTVCSQKGEGYVGTSVTNGVEEICQTLVSVGRKDWSVWNPDLYAWLEHYPIGRGIVEGDYTLMRVIFEDGVLTWDSNMKWSEASEFTNIPVSALAFGYQNEQSKKR